MWQDFVLCGSLINNDNKMCLEKQSGRSGHSSAVEVLGESCFDALVGRQGLLAHVLAQMVPEMLAG